MLVIESKGISGLMTCSDSPMGLCSGQLSGLGVWHTARYSIHLQSATVGSEKRRDR